MDDSPQELVVRAQSEDEAAFARLVRLYERKALAIAYAIVGSATLAGDVTQEAFLRVWQNLAKLSDPARFGAWLSQIVRNAAHDQLRRRPREIQQADHQHPLGTGHRLIVDPAAEIDRRELRNGINAALDQLDEQTRSAVALRYYENMSSKEIAELLDLTPAAVDMRLSRARAELRKMLAPLAPQKAAASKE